MFSFTYSYYPPKQAIEHNGGSPWSVGVGIHFNFFDKPEVGKKLSQPESYSRDINILELSSANITPSKPAMILILLCWQLLVFNLVARREQL